MFLCFFFFKQKTAYEMRISDWSSDVCSSDLTCSFPFTHWALRRPAPSKPLQIFVTQNGDWPAYASNSEYRSFSCDGLVCTNPDYLERNSARWNCALIPNGVDLARFRPGAAERARFDRSEEHTSELQSLMRISYAVFCLKKKK